MTASATLPAPSGPYLETALQPATGHRVVAVGSGLGGLTATKALKHDLVNITDALVFLTRMTAQGAAHVHNQASLWPHATPATATLFASVGVLISLYVTIIRKRKSGAAPGDCDCLGSLWRSQQTQKGWC